MNNLLITVGGILTGSGFMAMVFGFEAKTSTSNLSTSFSEAGYSGLDQWGMTTTGQIGLALVVVGIISMSVANRVIWKETDGY
jgi:hypothetical protein